MTEHATPANADDRRPGEDAPDEPGHAEQTETVTTGSGPDEASGDAVSDPALDDRVGSDWADEGGATPTGPAV